jgi:hypothetical protein
MAPIELGHLRAQIKYLFQHFDSAETFVENLLAILKRYRQKKNTTNSWLSTSTSLPAYHIPEILITEIQSSLEKPIHLNPDSALEIVNILWEEEEYEPKMFAYWIMFHLPAEFFPIILTSLEQWVEENPDDYLISQVVGECFARKGLLLTGQFISVSNRWLQSKDAKQRKIGIKALEKLAGHKSFTNFPRLFQFTEDQITAPVIEVRKDLLNLIQTLISRSEAETAAFLISVGQIHQNEKLLAFIRRCIPLFDDFYRREIESVLFE